MNLLKYFQPVRVTDKISNRFVDTGRVPDDIIRLLAIKVMGAKTLSDNEQAIFFVKTSEVNEMIIRISKVA
jgi:hypothetical protein